MCRAYIISGFIFGKRGFAGLCFDAYRPGSGYSQSASGNGKREANA